METENVNNILDVMQSNEFVIAQRLQLMSNAYQTLMNVANAKEGIEAIGQIMLLARELGDLIRKILDEWECPPSLIRQGNHFTEANLDNIWNSCFHFFNRYSHSKSKEGKVQELTRLYYLLLDVAEVAMVTKVERYTTGVKKMKSIIAEGY